MIEQQHHQYPDDYGRQWAREEAMARFFGRILGWGAVACLCMAVYVMVR